MLDVEDRTEAYIQSLILKKTFESISIDFRRSGVTGEHSAYKRNLKEAARKIFKKLDSLEPTVV